MIDKAGVTAYRNMLIKAQAAIKMAMKGGKSADEVIAAGPLKALNSTWGKGFLKPAMFIKIMMGDMK